MGVFFRKKPTQITEGGGSSGVGTKPLDETKLADGSLIRYNQFKGAFEAVNVIDFGTFQTGTETGANGEDGIIVDPDQEPETETGSEPPTTPSPEPVVEETFISIEPASITLNKGEELTFQEFVVTTDQNTYSFNVVDFKAPETTIVDTTSGTFKAVAEGSTIVSKTFTTEKGNELTATISIIVEAAVLVGGTGTFTAEDPYLISTPEHLQTLRTATNATTVSHFKLINDIDMAGVAWAPLSEVSFNLEGQNHAIKNLSINTTASNAGFIGATSKPVTVRNLVFDAANVKSTLDNVGIVAGYTNGGTFENVHIRNNSRLEGREFVGSFIGNISGTSIKRCSATDTIAIGGRTFGGFIGKAINLNAGNIKECFANVLLASNGAATGRDGAFIAGFIAEVSGSNAIVDCYSVIGEYGDTTTGWCAAGFVSHTIGKVYNAYSWGEALFNKANTNPFGGWQDGGSVTNCFYNDDLTTGSATESSAAKPLTTDKFDEIASFTNWDFTNVWEIDASLGRPVLKNNREAA